VEQERALGNRQWALGKDHQQDTGYGYGIACANRDIDIDIEIALETAGPSAFHGVPNFWGGVCPPNAGAYLHEVSMLLGSNSPELFVSPAQDAEDVGGPPRALSTEH
jgi:hypothetical protein